MSVAHAKYDWDTMDFGGTSRYDFDRLRNAEPETLAEAVLDACSDIVYGHEPFDQTADGQFMRAAVEKLQSKLRSLASMAQADPVKSFAFYNVLETAHSFRERHVPYEYKNGVRVERKCMGCGRTEKNCTTAVSLAGPYDCKAFSSGTDKLSGAWKAYEENYVEVFAKDWVDSSTKGGRLPYEDCGDYMLGECCLRKAKLTFSAQTLMAELMYETDICNNTGDEFVQKLLVDVRNLEFCIADGQRALPVNLDPIYTDDRFWAQIDEARSAAARGLQHKIPELAGNRARQRMGQPPLSQEQQQEAGSEEDVYASDEDGVDEGDDAKGPRNDDEPVRRHRLRKGRRAVLPEDEEESDAEVEVKDVGRHQRGCAPKGKRQSKRLRGCEPSPERAPEAVANPEEATPLLEKKKSRPGAASLARAQRIPGGALAARTEVLCELTKLKLRLMREGHREDAAVCTAAIFTLEELMELNRRAE